MSKDIRELFARPVSPDGTFIRPDTAGIAEVLSNVPETTVDIDLLDVSPRHSRLAIEQNDRAFEDLLLSIAEQGQLQPLIIRPSPVSEGRYEIVMGVRRKLALIRLGARQARVKIVRMDDYQALVAGSSHNTVHSALTYSEKVVHVRRLEAFAASAGLDVARLVRDSVSVRVNELTRIRKILTIVPIDVFEQVGPAPMIRKDLWWRLACQMEVERKDAYERLQRLFTTPDFLAQGSDGRFDKVRLELGMPRPEIISVNSVTGKQGMLGTIKHRAAKTTVEIPDRRIADLIQKELPFTAMRVNDPILNREVEEMQARAEKRHQARLARFAKQELLPA